MSPLVLPDAALHVADGEGHMSILTRLAGRMLDELTARVEPRFSTSPDPRSGGANVMAIAWAADELRLIGAAEELVIATRRADGTPRRGVPIWVVCVSGQIYVRTWYRRDSGWFGHAVDSRRARIRVPGLESEVTVEDVGAGRGVAGRRGGGGDEAELRAGVDAAYLAKYGRYGETSVAKMVSDDAAATTLRLIAVSGTGTGPAG